MKKVVVFAAALMVTCFLPWSVFAQGFPGYIGSPSSSLFPASLTDSYNLWGFNLTGNAKIGYMKMGTNFNLPTRPPFPIMAAEASIDLQLRGNWYWMGSVGLSSQITPDLSLSVYAEGNLQRNVTAFSAENDLPLFDGFFQLTWEASKVQWWDVDARAAYKLCPQYSILAGFRADHLSFNLRDPVDQFGDPVNLNFSIDGFALEQRVAGDFLGKVWIPYIGLRFNGQCWHFDLLWSPVAWASVKIPNRLVQSISIEDEVDINLSNALGLQYALKKPGCFLEGEFEYDWNLRGPLSFQLWAKGSWLRIRGRGTMDAQSNAAVNGVSLSESFADDARGTYTRYSIGGGIGTTLTF
jgi:hypothetical protein